MTNTPTILLSYLDEIGGEGSRVAPDPAAAKSLPVFVGRIYKTYRGHVFGQDYLLLICGAEDQPTPGQVEKHAEIVRSALGTNVAFVFPALPAFDRKRLVQRRIPFIVPGRQVYLPMVMIDLREKARTRTTIDGPQRKALSAPAQVILLFHLQGAPNPEGWPLNQWADALGYSRMTLSRACRELLSTDLCRPSGKGRQVVMQFPPKRRELWQKALPYLRNPVAGRSYVKIVNRHELPLYRAGMSALAQFTMISAGREEACAISSVAYRAALENHKMILVPYGDEDTTAVQRWRYDPGILSPDGHTVDRLSLYLSLQYDQDERVQAALNEMLEAMPW